MPPRKPANVPYPGPGDGYPAGGYVRIKKDAGATREELGELQKLLEAENPKSPLLTVIVGCEQGLPKYDECELWLYNYWHTSSDDDKEHCTFRLFVDVNTPDEPWNSVTYHLYRDAEVVGWSYDKPDN